MSENLQKTKEKKYLPKRVRKFLPLPQKMLPAGETTHPGVLIAYIFLGIIAVFLFVIMGF